MLLDDAAQGTQAWLDARAGHVTASQFSDALAKGKTGGDSVTRRKYLTRLVAERLTNKPLATFENDETRRGTALEPFARLAYEQRSGNVVEQAGFTRHPLLDWCGASVDGLIEDDGTLEIKSVLPHIQVITLTAGGFPSEHKAQIQGVLWVTDREYCDFVSYSPDLPGKLALYVYRVTRDDTFINEILEPGILKFLEEVDAAVTALMRLAA